MTRDLLIGWGIVWITLAFVNIVLGLDVTWGFLGLSFTISTFFLLPLAILILTKPTQRRSEKNEHS